MSERDTFKTSSQRYHGNVPSVDSPIMAGMKDVQTGDVNPPNQGRNIYDTEQFSNGQGRTRHGSPIFYALLEDMAVTHDRKSHDYASNDDPFGNYEFAGMMSQLFNDSRDAGFVGRFAEKIYRLANLENDGKVPANETIEDTEKDICVIVTLWMAARRKRRMSLMKSNHPLSR